MNLYEIDEKILTCIDNDTGEVIDEDKLSELELEREFKIENVALWIKNLRAESEALKNEKQSFEKRQKIAENKLSSLKKYLSTYMDGSTFKSDKVIVNFRKSESIIIDDLYKVPEDFLKFNEPSVDKMALKRLIKEGNEIDGVNLVTNYNIQIK